MPTACWTAITILATAADATPALNVPEPSYAPYVNGFLAIPFVLILLLAAKLAAWADKDARTNRMPQQWLNLGNLAAITLASIFFLLLPSFLLAFAAFLLTLLAAAGVYLAVRNSAVGLGDLGDEVRAYFASFGPKDSGRRKKKEDEAIEGEVILYNRDKQPMKPPLEDEPDRPAYIALQQIIADPLLKQAERIDLVPGSNGSQVRYAVDGVPYPGVTLTNDQASGAVAYLKRLIGADASERRKIQTGTLTAKSTHGTHKIDVSTSGSTAGEQVKMEVDVAKRYNMKLEDLGFRRSQLERIDGQLSDAGVVLIACPPNNGLHTLLYAFLRQHDAFLQHIQTLERKALLDLEGITQNELQPGEDERERVEWLASQQPDVLMVEKVEKPAAAKEVCEFAREKTVYVGIRASSTFDAITRWRKFVGDDKLALSTLKMAVAGRVFRRLCPATKIAYKPDERTLRAMGMSADKVPQLYKAHLGPLTDAKGNEVPDTFCHGLGYKGRIGAYEVFLLDAEIRKALASGASGQQIKSLFRKQNGRYVQEMALGIVQLGETDLAEVQRVMQSNDSKGGKS